MKSDTTPYHDAVFRKSKMFKSKKRNATRLGGHQKAFREIMEMFGELRKGFEKSIPEPNFYFPFLLFYYFPNRRGAQGLKQSRPITPVAYILSIRRVRSETETIPVWLRVQVRLKRPFQLAIGCGNRFNVLTSL